MLAIMCNPAGLLYNQNNTHFSFIEGENNCQPSTVGFYYVNKYMKLNKNAKTSGLEKLLKEKDAQYLKLKEDNERLKEQLNKSEKTIAEIQASFEILENNLKQCIEDYGKLKAQYQEMLELMKQTSEKYISEMKILKDKMRR